MEEDLFQTDASLRAEGMALLDGRGLRKLIEKYAPVYVFGSMTLELMVWRDMGLAMDAPGLTVKQFFELGARISLWPDRSSLGAARLHMRPPSLRRIMPDPPGIPPPSLFTPRTVVGRVGITDCAASVATTCAHEPKW